MDVINQGWFGVIAGLVISVYFFYKSRNVPRLSFLSSATSVVTLAGDADIRSHVKVSYRGAAVPQLTVITVLLWNSGRATLDGSALVPRAPIQLCPSSAGQILEAALDLNPKPACGSAVVWIAEGNPQITFDFLDPGDGFSVRLLHTGAVGTVRVEGVLKGARIVNEDQATRVLDRVLRRAPFTVAAYLCFWCAAMTLWVAFMGTKDAGAPLWFRPAFNLHPVIYVLVVVVLIAGFFVADTVGDKKAARIPPFLSRGMFRRPK